MIMSMRKQGLFETSAMVKIGMLSGLGMVLMLLNFPLPIFPTFLKIDFSDAPALVGTFYMGPAAGVLIQLLKNILKVIVENNTGGVGELANFLVGTAYVIPLGQSTRSGRTILECSGIDPISTGHDNGCRYPQLLRVHSRFRLGDGC